VLKYFSANFPNSGSISFNTPFTAEFMEAVVTLNAPVEGGESGNETLHIAGTATIPTTFTRVLSAFGCTTCDDITVVAEAEVHRQITALDLVLSFDMSASMKKPESKILKTRDAAITLLDTLYGADNDTSPTYTVDGTPYNLLNVGFVPWNAEVNIRVQQTASSLASITPVTTSGVGSFTNPVTGVSQSVVYFAGNSSVPLLMDPRTPAQGGQLPGGWSGCVWARYLGDSNNGNDADLVRGAVTVGGKQWLGHEPEGNYDGEPRDGEWQGSEGPSNTRWVTRNDWDNKNCNNSYVNDAGSTNYDNANGSIKNTPAPYSATNTSRPEAVPNPKSAPSATYSGTFRFIDSTTSYSKPAIGDNPASYECPACLTRGIIPLTPDKALMTELLRGIQGDDPGGNTNTLQGLYWAWEVLMPGAPFDEAMPTVPFKRTRAIVLLTDGELFIGSSGDAYKGRFGYHEIAGTNTDPAHGQIEYRGSTVQNNLDNRLKVLADNIKDNGIRIYIVAFNIADQYDLNRLRSIASEPTSQFFFEAPSASDLEIVFKQIASSLTELRLSM